MMDINVQLHSVLRNKLPPESKGKTVIHLKDEACLQDLLEELEITRKVVISVNGDHISDKLQPLKNGDTVKIFSPIMGG